MHVYIKKYKVPVVGTEVIIGAVIYPTHTTMVLDTNGIIMPG